MSKSLTLVLDEFDIRVKFEMTNIETLRVDHSYQRETTELIEFIGANFNPLAFGSVIIGERENGSRYIVDGQQRTGGAKKAGYKHVPCMIFKSEGKEQEAKLFRFLNQFRKTVSIVDIFRASIIEGEPEAVSIDAAVRKAGFKVALRSNMGTKWPYISSVEQLRYIHKRSGPEALYDTLLTIGNLWPGQSEALRRESVRGMYLLLDSFGATMDFDRLTEKMKGQSMAYILNQASIEKSREKGRGNSMKLFQCVFQILRRLYDKKVPSLDKAHPVVETNQKSVKE